MSKSEVEMISLDWNIFEDISVPGIGPLLGTKMALTESVEKEALITS